VAEALAKVLGWLERETVRVGGEESPTPPSLRAL
jgi:hypothetical protein